MIEDTRCRSCKKLPYMHSAISACKRYNPPLNGRKLYFTGFHSRHDEQAAKATKKRRRR